MTELNGFWDRIIMRWGELAFARSKTEYKEWADVDPFLKTFWYEIARDGLDSLELPETDLALKWILSGISEDTICRMLMATVAARKYKRDRQEMINSISDPILRKAAMK